ncbi:LOW QUALITY PROTEIN: alpha-2-macroglobulin-like protein 1 [Aphomia sociella]
MQATAEDYSEPVALTIIGEGPMFSGRPKTKMINPCTDRNHLFLAPGVLTAGGSNRACISRFYPHGPVQVLLTLRTEDSKVVTASRNLPTGDGGCLEISVPQKPNTKADLIVNVRYPEAKCTWERHMTVRISGGKLVMIHTDRARYRPGETLRIRVFVLKANLAPALGSIDDIWLEGPRGAWAGTRAAQWLRAPTRLGIAQLQHELDAQAPTGKWTVRAQLADGSQGSAVFLVGNYELPPMSVRHAAKVLRTSERLVWTVCVRYPWTEAVEGMLVIRIRGAGGTSSGGIRTAERLRAPRACHRHAAAAKRIGLNDTNPPDVVVADFSFQEEGTGIWQNTTVVSQVVDKRVSLEFLTKHRAVISPGLPYKLKIKATRWDEKPATNERIRVCRSPVDTTVFSQTASNATQTCSEAVTDEKGVARVMFTLADDGSSLYQFQAQLHNDSAVSAAPLQLPAHRRGALYAALGPLRATLPSTPASPHSPHSDRMTVPLYITLQDTTQPVTVHFVLITRGGIIHRWGASTQCALSNSGDHFQITPRDSRCYSANAARPDTSVKFDTNTSDSLLDRHLLRVMLPIKLTHQVCPDSHLIAYFYHNNELVSATKQFEMEECFGNKVDLTWLSRQTAPGGLARLLVRAEPRALCALSALDAAVARPRRAPAPPPAHALVAALRRLMQYRSNLTEYDASRLCYLTSDTSELPTSRLELTAVWLAAAGVRLLGGDTVHPTRCTSAPAPLIDEDATVPRSDFSEAWLWRLVDVGANGSVITNARAPDSISRFEATAMCVTKTGVAVSTPATLQVFREFFIHADAPKRLRRGDSTIIRYRLFNYLYEPLSVQVHVAVDVHLEQLQVPSQLSVVCVGARAAAARHVRLRALLPGTARLSVRARALRSGGCLPPGAGDADAAGPAVSDEVIIQITVDPEGVPVQEHHSTLLCAEGSLESGRSHMAWSWPAVDAVPGTEELTVWAAGDVAGPLLADADALVSLPRGCGEQNMARLATNLLALQQLEPLSAAAVAAKEHVARGFTRQLQYVHPSGGFSAFGGSDAVPSTWLTAFTLRYLRRAHEVLSPGQPAPPVIDRAEQWLLRQQMENGCFRNEGQVFHKELRGGLNEEGEIASVTLTAYVITSLIESSTSLSYRVVRNTLSCLRALPPLKIKSPTRIYAQSLLAYTFMRLRKYEDDLRKTNEAYLMWERKTAVEGLEEDEEVRELLELLKVARRSGDYVWWETSSLATSVEATAYALLALSRCARGDVTRRRACAGDARAAVRWLCAHRNAAGGFISTQDTLVAIEALTMWSSVQPLAPTNLTVAATTSAGTKHVTLRPDDKVPDVMKLEPRDRLHVAVEGSGCALVQATRSYHTLSSSESSDKLLSVQVSVHTDGAFHCTANTSCFCAAVIEACVMWSGQFPEMALLEMTLPGGYGADAQLLYSQLRQTDSLLRRIELSPKSGRTTFYLATHDGSDTLGPGGHQCYNVHAVGPKTRTKPAYARVMDYYRPSINDTQMYTIPEDCPARISTEPNLYNSEDNLYNNARSLSGEIIIMNEYSFEDIPEGIPLDDPMYDNLTQDVNKSSNNDSQIVEGNELIGNDKEENITRVKDTEKPEAVELIADDFNLGAFENTSKSEDNLHDANNFEPIISDPNAIILDKNENFNSKLKTSYDVQSVIHKHLEANEEDKIYKEEYKNIENNKRIDTNNEVTKTNEMNHRIEERDDTIESDNPIQNPTLSSFYVIDSQKDLEVPSGIEGPVPAVVLPPQNFVAVALAPPDIQAPQLTSADMNRGFQSYSFQPQHVSIQNHMFPYYYQRNPYYRNYRWYGAGE